MNRNLLPQLILLLLGGVLTACGEDTTTDIRAYYFPLRELTDGLVYEYRDVRNDSLTADYWYYRSLPTDTAFYFTKALYQNDFTQRQLYREEMVANGILVRDLFIYENDSTGQQIPVQAQILQANTFPFEVVDSTLSYPYRARFQLPSQPHGQTTLNMQRRYLGDTTYRFQGTTYPAIQFAISGSVDQRDSIIGDIEPHFKGREIYAKGIGLVYYQRSFGQVSGLQHQLVARYPMTELERRALEQQ
ncbi:MAG: hypothetical protein AAGJ82_13910 [Bacteroidota bacterium]